ncbi:MAG: autotransporter domain-containing protein [Tistlia sp.]|uniref:autotransporter domain-containing protein n=1 Tax=Tistlia sp. TaxID=3057121 RepID=UPI0034A16EC5
MRKTLTGLLAATALSVPAPTQAVVIRDDVAAAAGGLSNYFDSANAFPFVGYLDMGCTGTLIDARTIVTAAHCFGSQRDADLAGAGAVSFKSIVAAPADARFSSVLVHPDYREDVFARRDIAIIALDRPITSIRPIPLARSVTADGQEVVIVGYGLSTLASDPDGVLDDSRRRVATNSLDFLGRASDLPPSGDDELPDDQTVLAVDVDHVPEDPDYSSLGASLARALEGGGAPGDSGGPLFLVLPDGSLVLIGVLTGGHAPTEAAEVEGAIFNGKLMLGYGGITLWQSVPFFYDWLQENSFLRWTSAEAGDGDWSSPGHWSGGVVPNNAQGYVEGGRARYYNVTLDQAGRTRLDIDATVDSLTVRNALARLDILKSRTLETEAGTTLSSGLLHVDGSLKAAWLDLLGGTLAGRGRVSTSAGLLQTGGTVSPGGTGAIGRLSIEGTFDQRGGRLLAELKGAEADRLEVTGGTARLGGTLEVGLLSAPPDIGARFTVVTGDDLELSKLDDPEPLGAVTFQLVGSPQALSLEVGRQPLTNLATDANQAAIAAVLDAGRTSGLFPRSFYDSLDPLLAPELARAFDQIGGASTTAGTTARITSAQFLGAASQRVAAVRAGGALGGDNATALRLLMSPDPEASVLIDAGLDPSDEQLLSRPRFAGPSDGLGTAAAAGPVLALGRGSDQTSGSDALPFGVWVQPYGLWASRDGESRGDRYDTTLGGLAAGADYRLSGEGAESGLLLGLSFGYARADTGYDDLDGSTRQRSYQAGLYSGWWDGPWSLDAGLGIALNRYETERTVAFGAVKETAEGRYDGYEVSGYLEGGRRFELELGTGAALEVTPLAGLQFLHLSTESYDESGAGSLDLSVGSDRTTSLRSSLGAAFGYPLQLDAETLLRPEVHLRWSHEFADTHSSLDARLAAGGTGFAIRSGDLGRDAALIGAGVSAEIGSNLDLSLGYDAQVQSGYIAHAVTGLLRWSF